MNFSHRFEHISIIHFSQHEPFHHLLSQATSSLFQSASKKSIKDNHSSPFASLLGLSSIRQYRRTRTAACRVPAANCQRLGGSILCACVSPPRPPLPVPGLLCQAQRALRRRSPIVSWGKLPEASVEEMRWVGACRLKYLQRRHATASFIRRLARRTRKLSAVLNQSQILFFI